MYVPRHRQLLYHVKTWTQQLLQQQPLRQQLLQAVVEKGRNFQTRYRLINQTVKSLSRHVNPSNFSHRAERILYSRWKFVFKHMENLVPEGETLKDSYIEHILPHLRASFKAKKYAIDVLSYQVASLYAKRKDWVKEVTRTT